MKRMKDNGYGIWKIFDKYGLHDNRYWTMLVDPGGYSVWITCYFNLEEKGDVAFEMDDGGKNIPRRLMIKTSSIETIISKLIRFGITNNSEHIDSSLITINKVDDQKPEQERSGKSRGETTSEKTYV